MTPRGRHLHGTCIPSGCTYPESFMSLRLSVRRFGPSCMVFAKGSRGGTWHVPRGTWRHVTNAIVVPALWRIFWCLSRPNRTVRSGAIHKSPWTDTPTYILTNRLRPSCKNPPYPEEISIHQNGLSPILLHYDFELEAICFEPLVSRSLSFV